MGTSLQVYPFASLIDEVVPPTKMIYINKGINDKELENIFDEEDNVFLDGDADAWCHKISDILHWKNDFESLISKNRATKAEIDDVTKKIKELKIEECKDSKKEEAKCSVNSSTISQSSKPECAQKEVIEKESKSGEIDISVKPKL